MGLFCCGRITLTLITGRFRIMQRMRACMWKMRTHRTGRRMLSGKITVAGEAYTEHILGCIRECRSCGIPTLVLHPANGAPSLPEHTVGIDRFKRIIEAAERHSVNIAAEN